MYFDFPCVILAGGKSSRFGENKALYQINNQPLIQIQYNKLSKIFTKTYVSTKNNIFTPHYKIILDKSDIYSPMIALQSILTFINTDKVFIIPVDTPSISEITIKKIIENSQENDITIVKTPNKTHYLTGIFYKSALHEINNLLNKEKHQISDLIKNVKTNIISHYNDDEFLNINTKEDLDRFLSE